MSRFPEPVYCKVAPEVGNPLGLKTNYTTDAGVPWCRYALLSFDERSVRVACYGANDDGVVVIPREHVVLPREVKDNARSMGAREAGALLASPIDAGRLSYVAREAR